MANELAYIFVHGQVAAGNFDKSILDNFDSDSKTADSLIAYVSQAPNKTASFIGEDGAGIHFKVTENGIITMSLTDANGVVRQVIAYETNAELGFQRVRLYTFNEQGHIQKGFVGDNSNGDFVYTQIAEFSTTDVEFWLAAPAFTSPTVVRYDPLVLDLDGGGVQFQTLAESETFFDLDGNGRAERTGWVSKGDGTLVLDRNENGLIDNIAELFGNATTNGFAALKLLDTNNDNKISDLDAEFGKLRVWRDDDGDGFAMSSELYTLQQLGIAEIGLGSSTVSQMRGDTRVTHLGSYTKSDGTTGEAASVEYTRDVGQTRQTFSGTLSQDILDKPNLTGTGNLNPLRWAMSSDAGLKAKVDALLTSTAVAATYLESFRQMLYDWAGSDGLAANARGGSVDARKLVFLETLYGRGYAETNSIGQVTSNPSSTNAPGLNTLFDQIVASMAAEFATQGLRKLLADIAPGMPATGIAAKIAYLDPLLPGNGKGMVSSLGAEARTALLNEAFASPVDRLVASLWGDTNVIPGTTAAETLNGTANTDIVYVGNGDTAQGAAGSDLYRILPSTTFGAINDADATLSGNSPAAADVLALEGRLPSDIVAWWDLANPNADGSVDLYLRSLSDRGVIRLVGQGDVARGVEVIAFDDGTLWDKAAIAGLPNFSGFVVTGTSGNDVLTGWRGDETIDGGDGVDTLSYANSTAGVNVSLLTGAASGGDAQGDVFTGMENLIGSESADILEGDESANVLTGLAGDDRIDGRAGNDTMVGGKGNDTYVVSEVGDVVTELANEGIDTVETSLSTYTLGANVENLVYTGSGTIVGTGNALDNRFWGGAGADRFNGSSGYDTIDYRYSVAGVTVNLQTGTGLGGHAQGDVLTSFENFLGSIYDDVIVGNTDHNYLNGNLGNDTMSGGAGNDVYIVQEVGDVVIENASAGTDEIRTTLSSYTLVANVENLTYLGTDAFTGIGNALNNTIRGADGNDVLDGGAGNDILAGGKGDDVYLAETGDTVQEVANEGLDEIRTNSAAFTLATNVENLTYLGSGNFTGSGNASANVLTGGSGNDTLDGRGGADILDGGDGSDTASYAISGIGVTVNLTTGVNTGGDAQGDVLISIENVTGSTLGDYLFGDAGANILNGGAGSDTLDGAGGADTLIGGAGNDILVVNDPGDVVIELAGGGTDEVKTWMLSTTLMNEVENLTLLGPFSAPTGPFGQTGIGNSLANVITGNVGNDVLEGLGGNDTLSGGLGDDILRGGDGNDILNGGEGADLLEGDDGNDTLNGNAGGDVLLGGLGDDTLQGGDGDDTLFGGDGNDNLWGDAGTDVLDGGDGVDWVRYSGLGVTVNLTTGLGSGNLAQGDTYDNIENIAGSAYDDTLIGNAQSNQILGGGGNDTLDGRGGDDILAGGIGNDIYIVDSLGAVINENINEGVDEIRTTLSTFTLVQANVENLRYMGAGDFTGVGNGLNNVIYGGAGNDFLDGGSGNDTMVGGLGDDRYVVDSASDVVTEMANGGTDEILTSLSAYSLSSRPAVENLTYTGTSGFTGTGNALANRIVGAVGSDLLDGGTGADVLVGGAGNDVYLIDNVGDVAIEQVDEGTDTVRTTLNSFALGLNVENLEFKGTGAFAGTGNALDNVITGGTGNDTLNGGEGADVLIGGVGNDIYLVDSVDDVVTENANEGVDEIRSSVSGVTLHANVENLRFVGVGDFVGTGNALVNQIYGGDGDDFLDGDAGADNLAGGLGDDIYIADHTWENIVEFANGGIDEIRTSIANFTLNWGARTNVENLTFTGSGDFFGYGNALDNVVRGGSGNDYFDGLDGADTFIGGAGNDHYIIKDIGDVVVEHANEGTDKVTIYNLLTYTLGDNIEAGYFFGSPTDQFLSRTMIGNDLNNTVSGREGDDFLYGGAGNDTLWGNDGDDTLTGGSGADILYGIGGTDTAIFEGNWRDYNIDILSQDWIILRSKANYAEVDQAYQVELFKFADTGEALTAADLANVGPNGISTSFAWTFQEGLYAKDTLIGTLTMQDLNAYDLARSWNVSLPEGETPFYRVERQADGTGKLFFDRDVTLDYETWNAISGGSGNFAGTPYEMTLGVTDWGNLFWTSRFGLTVLDVAEAPVPVGPATRETTVRSGTATAIDASLVDDDSPTLAYTLSGEDAALFQISSTGELSFLSQPDVEAPADADADNVYDVTVRATDLTGLFGEQRHLVTVGEPNKAPTDVFWAAGGSVMENATGLVHVGTLGASDPDAGETFTYSLVGTGDLFEIIGNDLYAKAPLDYEQQTSHTVTVRATDQSGAAVDRELTVAVNDGMDQLTGTEQADTLQGTAGDDWILAFGGDDTIIASMGFNDVDGGEGNDTYVLNGKWSDYRLYSFGSGFYQIVDTTSSGWNVSMLASIEHLTFMGHEDGPVIFAIEEAVNVAPTVSGNQAITLAEGTYQAGHVIANFTAADTNVFDRISNWKVQDPNANPFLPPDLDVSIRMLADGSGELYFNKTVTLSFDQTLTPLRVSAYDLEGAPGDLDVSIQVTDVNWAPTLTSNGGAPSRTIHVPQGAIFVSDVMASDPDGTDPSIVLEGADALAFIYDASDRSLKFATNPDHADPADADGDNVYEVTVRATDGDLSDTQQISVVVNAATEIVRVPRVSLSEVKGQEDSPINVGKGILVQGIDGSRLEYVDVTWNQAASHSIVAVQGATVAEITGGIRVIGPSDAAIQATIDSLHLDMGANVAADPIVTVSARALDAQDNASEVSTSTRTFDVQAVADEIEYELDRVPWDSIYGRTIGFQSDGIGEYRIKVKPFTADTDGSETMTHDVKVEWLAGGSISFDGEYLEIDVSDDEVFNGTLHIQSTSHESELPSQSQAWLTVFLWT